MKVDEYQESAMVSVKGLRINISGFLRDIIYITSPQLCHRSTKAVADNTERNGGSCVLMMLEKKARFGL